MLLRETRLCIALLWTLLLAWGGSEGLATPSEIGLPTLQFFDKRQSGSNQTGLCMAQGADGTMFFGGGEAVLSFDGEVWTRYPTQNASLAQTLATDENNRLWVAGSNVIGYFEHSTAGLSAFHSLKDRLPEHLRHSFNIWYMFPRDRDVIFVEEGAVLRWDGSILQEWSMPDTVRLTALRNEREVYIHQRSTGLWRFGEARPELFLPRERIGDNSILWVERRDDAWLLVTGNGIRLVGGAGLRRPCPAADEFISRNFLASVSHPAGLPVLIATIRGGLVALGDDWSLRPFLNSSLGAPNNVAFMSFLDRQGALWVGFDEGVVRLGQPGYTRLIGPAQGLGKHSAIDLLPEKDALLIATQEGLLRLDTRAPEPTLTRLEKHENYYLRLLSRGDLRLAIGFSVIERLGTDIPARLHKARAKMEDAVLSDRHPGLLYFVDGDGLFSMPVAGNTVGTATRIATMHETIIGLLEDDEGGLWASGETKGLTHVRPGGDGSLARGEVCVLLEDQHVRISKAGSHLLVISEKGTQRYDPQRGKLVDIPGLPLLPVINCSLTGTDGNVWIAYESPFPSGVRPPVIGRLHLSPEGEASWLPFALEGLNEFSGLRCLVQDDQGLLWIGGDSGILRVDTSLLPKAAQPPAPPHLQTNITDGEQIPSKGNPILVHLATAEYGHRDNLRFQTRLDGTGEDWSLPGNNPDLSFAGLREGSYTLRARVLSDSGLVSDEQRLRFTILPPWWWSKTALTCWMLLLLGAAIALPLGHSRYLRVQNRRLNELVRLRTLELERSATAKVEFVRALSHELRNPIAGAGLMAELMQGGTRGGRLEEHATNLRNCIDYLETLLEGALDLTQAESGRIALKMESFTPESLLRDTAAIFGPLAARNGLDFTLDAGPEPRQALLGDLIQTKRILVNYLSNAFKFTAHGSVRVRASLSKPDEGTRRLRLEVEDSGRGIPPHIQSRLFREFIREGTRTEAGEKPGAGLGLALCRRLAALAGGSVGFASRDGAGSVFWAELPFIIGGESPASQEEHHLPPADFSGMDVCLVDDDPLHLDALYATLEQFGIVALKAGSAEEAKLIIKNKDCDLVLFDYSLGSTTGLQLLKELRQEHALGPSTHCHLITGMLDVELTREASAAGFQGAHRKPLSSVALFRILKDSKERD